MNSANAVLKAQLCVRQEGIETLKAQVSSLEKQLKETHEEGKDQIVQLKAQVAVLDRKLEAAALVSEHELICWKLYVNIMQFLITIRFVVSSIWKCHTPLSK
jgi:hypothetical protein